MKRTAIFSFIAGGLLLLCSCSTVEKAEEATADITAAQMEGRRAARDFINREWRDTMALQHSLLEAKAKQSKYIIEGRQDCAAAFDSGFISTLRAVRPDVARHFKK